MVTIRSAIPTLAWLVAGVLFCAQTAAAHGGRLNAQGCHNDRKNGGYHCHRGNAAAPRPTPPAATPATAAAQHPDRGQGTQTYYANCSAARAAGAAPVRRGDPGYARHLDRDGDGIGCE